VLPASLPAALLVICHACCDFDPAMRPGFATVVEELTAAIDEIKAQVGGLGRRGAGGQGPGARGGARWKGAPGGRPRRGRRGWQPPPVRAPTTAPPPHTHTQEAAAAQGGLLGRLKNSATVPGSWVSVLSQLAKANG
jgi:hypothetical protein